MGLAALDLPQLELHLSQFVEPSRSFTLTLALLERYPPAQLVLLGAGGGQGGDGAGGAWRWGARGGGRGGGGGGADEPGQGGQGQGEGHSAAPAAAAEGGGGAGEDSPVNGAVRGALGAVPVATLPRAAFDDARGYLAVAAAASPPSAAVLASSATTASGRGGGGAGAQYYLAFGAAGALLAHVEASRGLVVTPGSLELRCGGSALHATLDRATVRALELVAPAGVVAGGGGRRGRPATLFQLLDGTRTQGGARLLRASLLQPLREVETLRMRWVALGGSGGAGWGSGDVVFDVIFGGRRKAPRRRRSIGLARRGACSEYR